MGLANIDGYVADSIYPSTFHPKFTPAWTDAILRWYRVETPRSKPRAPFTFVDLGCGDGIGLILLAAAYPEGRFIGVDGLEPHVALGREVAISLALDNISFHHSFFADAHGIADGEADYVMAQGVMAWVRADNRLHVLDLAGAMLRPGGVLSLGYNTLPGWSPLLGFQRLAFQLAQGMTGSSADRFEAAVDMMRGNGLIDPEILKWMDEKAAALPRGYFAHEYLNRHWEPLWSGDVIENAMARGFTYLAQAHPGRMRQDFTHKRAWRETLATIEDVPAREIAIDMLASSDYRIDLYTKGEPARLAPEVTEQHRLDQVWAAPIAEADARFAIRTPAGRVAFDNEAAHAILRRLEAGPAALRTVEGFSEADLLNTVDALQLAALVLPGEPPVPTPQAATANQMLADDRDGVPLQALVGAYGVFLVPPECVPPTDAVRSRLGIAPAPTPTPGDGLSAVAAA